MRFWTALLITCLLPALAAAQVVRSEQVTATLMTEAAVAAPGKAVRLGLHFDIADGWHTYWKNPGDSGGPTTIDWALPEGVEAGPIRWPHPEALPYGPLVNYGYEHEVLHLVDLTLPADWPVGMPVRLEAAGFWLVCADICIPEEGFFTLDLPTGPEVVEDPAVAPVFERFAAQVPRAAPFDVSATGPEPLRLSVAAPLDDGVEVHFFPDAPGVIEAAAPQRLTATDDGYVLTLQAVEPAASLSGVLVTAEQFGPQRFTEAFAIETAVEVVPATASSALQTLPLLTAIGLALAGGLLLNLMPCVLPVLSMKALALVEAGAADRGRARLEGFGYTAGVLTTFLIVAAALIAARQAGLQVGWGFQLQSPLIVAALAYLLFVVGLNLSGLFEVHVPVATGGGSAFMTGALAVLVATPCTAPFMATALGFALIQPPLVTLAIFVALGLGLALPFLLVTLSPGLARLLPRPGAWMVRLRQGLAFPMYASAAWLVWVLARQAGPDAVLAVLAGATLLAFGLWLAAPAGAKPSRLALGTGLAAAALALALLSVPALTRSGDAVAATATPELGEVFTEERLLAARADGGPVLVEMTAAWCITCQVNDRVALSGAAFEQLLEDTGTRYLVGDWTNRDPIIGAFIDRFGHPGVPLYVVYPAAEGPPEVLPQVLTPGIVREALERAAG